MPVASTNSCATVRRYGGTRSQWLYSALTEEPGAAVQCASPMVFRGIDTLRGEPTLLVGEVDRA